MVQTTGTPIPEFHTELYMLAIFIVASAAITIKKLRNAQLKPGKPF
jgi:hypothetical protein